MMKRLVAMTFLLPGILLGGAARSAKEPPPAEAEFFEKKVRPLLVARCFRCHGNGKSEGGLSFISRDRVLQGGDSGPAAESGHPEKSRLIWAIRYKDDALQMPPNKQLPLKEIEILERWVKKGLPWPKSGAISPNKENSFRISPAQRKFWSFQPVKALPPPKIQTDTWSRSPIDRFVFANLKRRDIEPAQSADKRTLLRRATFDLTGLPPTPQELDAFLDDHSPDAFARVVDRLLASPRYGERWGRHWLDVVRYADARDLIQLPPASDFREAWRYRDWVVKAFNQDLPYRDFVQYQLAGDLLQPSDPMHMNRDALVATGMLAIADFVPGDVDKELMIADYVNDQIDVVGRAFMGLTLACARCHDHKFDPISTEDYYGLAGIFFSTRLIPGPIAGNTPLVRVPLIPMAAIEKAKTKYAAALRRRGDIQDELALAVDREYLATVKRLATTQTAKYLAAACEFKERATGKEAISVAAIAKEHKVDAGLLAGWLEYLKRDRSAYKDWQKKSQEALAATSAKGLEQSLANESAQRAKEAAARTPEQKALADALLLHFKADNPHCQTNAKGQVILWPDQSCLPADAIPAKNKAGPVKAMAKMKGRDMPVLRFAGGEMLEARRAVPPRGSMFAVFRVARPAQAGQRLVGWEDAARGSHGLGLMFGAKGEIHAILRNNGRSGDMVHAGNAAGDFEIVSITWGKAGVTMHRDRKAAGASKAIHGLSSDPAIAALHIGGPGSGGNPTFRGDLAEVRVYDRQLNAASREKIEADLHATWIERAGKKPIPRNLVADLYDELVSPRGPFWPKSGDKTHLLPAEFKVRLRALRQELEALKTVRLPVVPEAVAVQDGGPKGTKHEGLRDAHVYLRGNHKKPGKKVPRRFPVLLAGERQPSITKGSGRVPLANWLTRPDHPLTARVMVNRLWQHHFGEGIVRTPNNFGERGERPTHPELLDHLAERFIQSGWSVKDLHRQIMLSSTYQQSSRGSPTALKQDPDNRLFSRMNRRRLDAEAIRDSLLAVAGSLDDRMGGPSFQEMAVPRRTLYLMSVRTGGNISDFAALFDRADPGSIVEKRSTSTVAPQALFFLNDPFVTVQAKALAARLATDAAMGQEETVSRLYLIVLGRLPNKAEAAVGLQQLEPKKDVNSLERYCNMLLCTNEFLYVD
jgi:hypothetical protein